MAITALQTDIERRLADSEPEVEVLLAEVLGGRQLRVFIDHPQGVTLELCERVSGRLTELRERYSLEVSSPGSERPLTKPAHFRRFIGRRARVRTRRPHPPAHAAFVSTGLTPAPVREQASGPRERASGPREQAAGPREQASGPREQAPGLRTSFTGELLGASEQEVTLAADGGVVAIPYDEIRRCNLIEE